MNGISKKLFIIILGLALFNGQTSFAFPVGNGTEVPPPPMIAAPPPVIGAPALTAAFMQAMKVVISQVTLNCVDNIFLNLNCLHVSTPVKMGLHLGLFLTKEIMTHKITGSNIFNSPFGKIGCAFDLLTLYFNSQASATCFKGIVLGQWIEANSTCVDL